MYDLYFRWDSASLKLSNTEVFLKYIYKFIYFIYLFLAALCLRCCVRAFSSCGERGLLFIELHGLLAAASRCGARALGAWASVVVALGP